MIGFVTDLQANFFHCICNSYNSLFDLIYSISITSENDILYE